MSDGKVPPPPHSFFERVMMGNLRLGANVTVFLLFFGIALLDAVRAGDWLRSALWLALGLVFLRADSLKREPDQTAPR